MTQLTGKLLLKSHPGVSAGDRLTENECPHHAFGALQREVEPRHRDGKNEEVGTKGERDRESMWCQESAGEKGFLCAGQSLKAGHHASPVPWSLLRMSRNCKCHLTGCLEI